MEVKGDLERPDRRLDRICGPNVGEWEGESHLGVVIVHFSTRWQWCFFLVFPSHYSDPLQPRFGTLWHLAFPKTKITFEREEVSGHWWNSGKYDRAADGDWENCVRSQGGLFRRGLRNHCPMYDVSCIFFNKSLWFSYYIAGYLLDRPRIIDI